MQQSPHRTIHQGARFDIRTRFSKPSNRMSKYLIGAQSSPDDAIAIDCEMVGVGPMKISVLARVSLVNAKGEKIFDTFVQVEENVTDYRTSVSGIRPSDLASSDAMSYGKCRHIVIKMLKGKILVGHGLSNDLTVLNLNLPAHLMRDTSQYPAFTRHGRPRKLRDLIWEFDKKIIQDGEHCSFQDARAAMSLYQLVKGAWEEDIAVTFSLQRSIPNYYVPSYDPSSFSKTGRSSGVEWNVKQRNSQNSQSVQHFW